MVVRTCGVGVGVGVGVEVGVAVGVDVGVGVGAASENTPHPTNASDKISNGDRRSRRIGLTDIVHRAAGYPMHLTAALLEDPAQLRLSGLLLSFCELRRRDDGPYGAVRDALLAAVALLTPHDELIRRLLDGVLRTHELADTAMRAIRCVRFIVPIGPFP